jgi:hypothetical protein
VVIYVAAILLIGIAPAFSQSSDAGHMPAAPADGKTVRPT